MTYFDEKWRKIWEYFWNMTENAMKIFYSDGKYSVLSILAISPCYSLLLSISVHLFSLSFSLLLSLLHSYSLFLSLFLPVVSLSVWWRVCLSVGQTMPHESSLLQYNGIVFLFIQCCIHISACIGGVFEVHLRYIWSAWKCIESVLEVPWNYSGGALEVPWGCLGGVF